MSEPSYPVSCRCCPKQLYGPVHFCPFCGSKVEPQKVTKRHPPEWKRHAEQLIEAAKYTRQEILKQVSEKYPNIKKDTIYVLLTDCKNPISYQKYTGFSRLTEVDPNGIYRFHK